MTPRKPSEAVELAASTLEEASRLLAETAKRMRQRAVERGDLTADDIPTVDEDEPPDDPGPAVA